VELVRGGEGGMALGWHFDLHKVYIMLVTNEYVHTTIK
jgi:hypothetical protein